MEKRSFDERYSDRVKVEEEPEIEPATVRLVLLKDIILKINGPITGILYTFNRAGSEVDVDERDAEIMMKRMGSNSCCSGISGPTKYFEVVR